MAEKDKKYHTNVEGKIYVDDSCIDCDLCRATVPEVFARHEDGYSYVFQQPTNSEIYLKTKEVIGECPVEAIGDDGELNETKGANDVIN